jgi:hypothetical protein
VLVFVFSFAGISDIGGILRILVDEVSQQRATIDQVVSKVALLEDATKKEHDKLNYALSMITGADVEKKKGHLSTPPCKNMSCKKNGFSSKGKNKKRLDSDRLHRNFPKKNGSLIAALAMGLQSDCGCLPSEDDCSKDSKKNDVLIAALAKGLQSACGCPPSEDDCNSESNFPKKNDALITTLAKGCGSEDNYSNEISCQDDMSKKEWMNCMKIMERLYSSLSKTSGAKPEINPTHSNPGQDLAAPASTARFSETIPTPLPPTVSANSSSCLIEESPTSTSVVSKLTTPTKPAATLRPSRLLAPGMVPGPFVKLITTVNAPLPSCEIDMSKLMSLETFMQCNSAALKEGKYSLANLTVRLALNVVFGREVLAKCSPFGCRQGLYGLPIAEFNILKQLVSDLSPSYWEQMDSFEAQWGTNCIRQLSGKCSALR